MSRLAGIVRRTEGIPRGLVAAMAILALAGILYAVATHDPKETRAWAEFTMFRHSCVVDQIQRKNVASCSFVKPGIYAVAFTESLFGRTVLVSRALCCLGPAVASIVADRTVVVRVPTVTRRPVRATVFVP